MSRYRDDRDDDFYAGEPRRREGEDHYGPARGGEGGGARWRYEQDERDAARGGGGGGGGL
ncbi:MAG: cold-shock protein, partial [Rubrivivax sp.]|nr:cold-shock protein [Pyrinomonadaceae bacterium]